MSFLEIVITTTILLLGVFLTLHVKENTKNDWKEAVVPSILAITTALVSFFVYYYYKDNAVVMAEDGINRVMQTFHFTGVIVLTFLIIASLGLLAWYLTDKLLKPSTKGKKFFLGVVVTLFTLLVLYVVLRENEVSKIFSRELSLWELLLQLWHTQDDLAMLFIGAMLIIVSVTFFAFKEKIQDFVAVPLGAVVILLLVNYTWSDRYGESLFSSFSGDDSVVVGGIVIVAIGLLYSTIWHVSKVYNKRFTYKVLAFVAFLLIGNAVYITGQNLIGGIDKDAKQITHTKNRAEKLTFERLKKVSMGQKYNGYTFEEAREIVDNPEKQSLETLEAATNSLLLHRDAVKKLSDDYEGPEFYVDNSKSDKLLRESLRMIPKGTEYLKDVIEDVFPGYKNGGGDYHIVYNANEHILFELEENSLTDHWIRLGDDVSVLTFSTIGKQYEYIFRDGSVVKIWKDEPLPPFFTCDFKIKVLKKGEVGLKFIPADPDLVAKMVK